MKISIVMPAYYSFPIGGYHVLYTYANLLCDKGHQVTILFPRKLWPFSSWLGRIKTRVWAIDTRLRNRSLTPHFKLRPKVRTRLISDLGRAALPEADALIATGWQTAELLKSTPDNRGRKFYLAHDYEFWKAGDAALRDRIARTYTSDFEILTTSDAVDGMVRQCGGRPRVRIPDGVDFDSFGRDIPGGERRALTLGFPARDEAFKGAADAIEAATLLREVYGDRLEVTAFGNAAIEMPSWIRRLRRPGQEALRNFYNSIAVFLVPSHFEGWGLPACEAMACGAALVTTDNGGSRDYAIDGETALVVQPRDPQQLAATVDRLFQDEVLRIALAERGHAFIQQFRWEKSTDILENVLMTQRPETVP